MKQSFSLNDAYVDVDGSADGEDGAHDADDGDELEGSFDVLRRISVSGYTKRHILTTLTSLTHISQSSNPKSEINLPGSSSRRGPGAGRWRQRRGSR